MRLLIFLLALMSAFFVPLTFADLPDLSDLKSPELKQNYCISAFGNEACSPDGLIDASQKACAIYASISSLPADTSTTRYIKQKCESKPYPKVAVYISRLCESSSCRGQWGPSQVGAYKNVTYSNSHSGDDYFCPPTEHPLHKIRVDKNPQPAEPPYFECAKPLDDSDCPAGYHSKAVSKALGGSGCVPKDCPDIGSGTSLASSKMTGGVPFSGGGMYCNDGCAYSVPESNITSQNYALGVSQGAACGDKPYDNKKLSDHDDGSKCELGTNGDVQVLFCSDPATPPDGTEPPKPDDPIAPVKNDDLKKDNTKTPDKPLLNCANEDVACQIENLKIQAENDAKNLREDQIDRFNSTLDADTRNTNAIIGAIEAFHTTVYIADQKADTYQLLAQSQIERLITTVENGSSTGGGSGGDGSGTGGGGGGGGGSGTGGGDGDGDGDGEPCEGSVSDCVPIEDSELPVSQVNLNQYADQYNDWLPTAELPEKSCVSLTDGTSLCLDFSSIILIFKALSSLLVISALLHSAKIISGAF